MNPKSSDLFAKLLMFHRCSNFNGGSLTPVKHLILTFKPFKPLIAGFISVLFSVSCLAKSRLYQGLVNSTAYQRCSQAEMLFTREKFFRGLKLGFV